jgi:uncharacterized membrane protein YjgN (DUF898 family)
MEFIKSGDLVLREVAGPDAEDRLVSTLLRVYRNYTPEQMRAFISKPKPMVLVRGIRETNALKLVEGLRGYGVSLQFVAADQRDQSPVSHSAPGHPPEASEPIPKRPLSPAAAGATDAPAPSETGVKISTETLAGGLEVPMTAIQDQDPQTAQPEVKPGPRKVALTFTGSAGEYFRIWIVNIALTILTLGVYVAWAKVRTRRYFYANTMLNGQPFDYLAKPGAILRGYLIVGGALLAMNITSRISPFIGYVITTIGWCLVPFLLYKAHRFKARYSAYRNIRFSFTGSIGGAYKAYAFIPIFFLLGFFASLPVLLSGQDTPNPVEPPSLIMMGVFALAGLLFLASFPYFAFLQRHYFHDNMDYGKTPSSFTGSAGRYYGIYIRAGGMMFGAGIAMALMVAVLMPAMIGFSREGNKPNTIGIIAVSFISYIVFLLLILLIQQYVYARTFNYSWGSTRLGTVRFDISLRARDLAWIRLTNILAIVFSLGFLTPWAKVRRTRYILPRTVATLPGDMGSFEPAEEYREDAVGDTAADFFDWDIGW